MLKLKIQPRFCETDALGHINNAVLLEWFEQARIPLFKIFTPDLDTKKWRLIIAKTSVDYLKQIDWEKETIVKTHVSKLGNSSMNIVHELYQQNEKVAEGLCVMVHFNYQNSQSERIPDRERIELERHLK